MRKMRINEEDETEDHSENHMGKIDNFKYNYDVYYNDDECEDIGKVRQMKIGQEDEENED